MSNRDIGSDESYLVLQKVAHSFGTEAQTSDNSAGTRCDSRHLFLGQASQNAVTSHTSFAIRTTASNYLTETEGFSWKRATEGVDPWQDVRLFGIVQTDEQGKVRTIPQDLKDYSTRSQK